MEVGLIIKEQEVGGIKIPIKDISDDGDDKTEMIFIVEIFKN